MHPFMLAQARALAAHDATRMVGRAVGGLLRSLRGKRYGRPKY